MKTASDKEIEERRKSSAEWLKATYKQPERNQTTPTFWDRPGIEQAPVARDHVVSKEKLDYLVLCAREPFLTVTMRDKKHGFSAGKGNGFRQELAAEGLLKLHRISTGRRGGQIQLTEVSEEGFKLLERYEVKVKRPAGRGGFEHRFWQAKVCEWAVKQGYPASIELEVEGKAVDVGVQWDEVNVAVEIVIEGIDKELGNVGKDLSSNWDRVVLCSVKQETLSRLREKVLDEFGEELIQQDKVRFVPLSRFL
jgi:hypothetical protein